MIIDSHQHFWQFDPIRDSWITDSMNTLRRDFLPADLRPVLQENDVSGTIAVQADQSDEETRFLLNLAGQHDFIKGVVGWIDFRARDIEDRLEGYVDTPKLCGFRHIAQSETDDRFLIQEDFMKGLKLLTPLNFTFDILIYEHQLTAAVELVNRMPEQKFVLDHIAKPRVRDHLMEPWASLIHELTGADNVFCKLSGMVTEADHLNWTPDHIRPYLDVVFEAFGPERLMFGSDWPVCLLAADYITVKSLIDDYIINFDEKDKRGILGENARIFYGIE